MFSYKLSSCVSHLGLSALRIEKSDTECNSKNQSESLECRNKAYDKVILWEDYCDSKKDTLRKRPDSRGSVKGILHLFKCNIYMHLQLIRCKREERGIAVSPEIFQPVWLVKMEMSLLVIRIF